jgi:hypothetical protein
MKDKMTLMYGVVVGGELSEIGEETSSTQSLQHVTPACAPSGSAQHLHTKWFLG